MSINVKRKHNNSKFKSVVKDKDWAASFFRRGRDQDPYQAQKLKTQFGTGNCDHRKIQDMRVESISFIDQLIIKETSGKKLNSKEKLHLSIYREQITKEYEEDCLKIKKQGLGANVTSDIGRLIKCIKVAEYQLSLDKPDMDKYIDVYYTSRKINEFTIPESIRTEYMKTFKQIDNAVKKVDTIMLQFNKYHGNMPPLNNLSFRKLADWQKKLLDNVDAKKSTIVEVSTSGGKSVVSMSIFNEENVRVLVCVPTAPLCWQTSAIIGKITGKDVPIVTKTYQTESAREELIKTIERCGIVVGTPQYLNDILPLLKIKFDWVIVDEFHMISSNSKEIELLLKVYNNVPTLLLSATIGNVEYIRDWLLKIGHSNFDTIKCDKRFIELQRSVAVKKNGVVGLVRIHPLASIDPKDFETGYILKKTLNATPPDIWVLATSLIDAKCKIGNLSPYIHFTKTQVITLDEAYEYFMLLLNWMVTNYQTCKTQINKILASYKNEDVEVDNISIYDISMHLKNIDELPAIIFHTDSHECLNYVKQLSQMIHRNEDIAHPNIMKERLKEQKLVEQTKDKMEKLKVDGMGGKQLQKLFLTGAFDNDMQSNVSFNEPHKDFIFNKTQFFSQHTVDQWNKELKKYFPQNGSSYHYIIDLLWRGIGVYVKGLPDAYLNIVQNYASNGKLAIVVSDDSLTVGISWPARSVVVTKDKINETLYHQMSGRAGRRGMDKKGNTIFLGWSWNDAVKISTSTIQNIKGGDTMFYGSIFAEKLSGGDPRWKNITKNFLLDQITDEDADEFYSGIEENLSVGGAWSDFMCSNDNFLHMVWRLRHSEDCIRLPFLLSFIRKIFTSCNPSNENTQVEFAKFLLQFIDIKEADDDNHVLSLAECSKKYNLFHHFNELGLEIPDKVDSMVYDTIQHNKIIDTKNTKEKSKLRQRLFDFGEKIIIIQHYFFYTKELTISRLLSKLLTRIWWIYHVSSPVMDSINEYINPTIDATTVKEAVLEVNSNKENRLQDEEDDSDSSDESSSEED